MTIYSGCRCAVLCSLAFIVHETSYNRLKTLQDKVSP